MASSSSSQSDFFYGWSLLFKTIDKSINKEADLVIALTHFMLTKHSSFRCVGIGDSKILDETDEGSELLPDNWNVDDSKYALRYAYNGVLFIMLGHITEGSLVINLLNVKDKSVSNICVEPGEMVVKTKGTLEEMVPTASNYADRLRKELLKPIFDGTKREGGTQTTQTNTTNNSTDPLRVGEPRRPMGQFAPNGFEPRPFGFPDVGRGDLDPLGRGGPGNLFEFPRRPDLGGGGIQPRFDPFGPPERNIRPNPNPDHFQPPGFGGDHYL